MNTSSIPVVTLDGPSGVGKGTIALRLARYLSWHLLDSGVLYRAVALAAQHHAIALEDEPALAKLALDLPIAFEQQSDLSGIRVLLENREVTHELRTESCGSAASQVAALPAVRQSLLFRQRAFKQPPGLIADGRDMGTVVFPEAIVKIFLTATAEERAQRRYKQLKEKGIDVNMSHLIVEITQRDERDATRSIAPSVPATDAWIIDTTTLSIEQVMASILQHLFKFFNLG